MSFAWIRRPASPIWQHADFRRVFGALAVSLVGTEITALALPTLAVMAFGADPAQVGLLKMAETLPLPILGLVAGVLADRLDARRTLIVADLARLLAVLSIPVAAALGALRLPQLYVVAAVCGVFTTFFNASFMTLFPRLLPREQLLDGNAKVSLTLSGSRTAGPAAGGWLIQLMGAPAAIVVDAVSYAASALQLLRVRTATGLSASGAGRPAPGSVSDRLGQFLKELAEGLRIVARDRVLRALVVVGALFNLGMSAIQALVVVFAYRELGFTAGDLGTVLTVGGAGLVLGSTFAHPIASRLGMARAIPAAIALSGLGLLCLPLARLASPRLVLAAAWFVSAAAVPIYDVAQVTLRQLVTPPQLQGRMNATVRTVIWGTVPLGAAVGGFAAEWTGFGAALGGSALAVLAAAAVAALSRLSPPAAPEAAPRPAAEPG